MIGGKVMKALNLQSKVKEVYANPIGQDIINKLLLQMGKSPVWITNPVVGNLRLGTVKKLVKNVLDEGFFDTFLALLNSAEEPVKAVMEPINPKWWKEKVVYQIYPRSFKDSNGDGIGDLRGIIEKLDYLEDLGVEVLWLSPIYDSPNDDNGYDIRDYYKIMQEFGTMEDFDQLLKAVHKRGMKLIMDLVLNHTSDEHPWFQSALTEENSPYKDYYHFAKSKSPDQPPNNWTSYFSGSAWNYYKEIDEWALHLFSKKQMDLNWENPKMRQELYTMINWWLEKGIDGFRLDVINYISKKEGLPDGNESIKKMMDFGGVEHYFYGPKLHDYLREMRQETVAHFDAFTVGETPGVGIEMSKQLIATERKELDMTFSFDHLEAPGHKRYDVYRYDLNDLKEIWIKTIRAYGNHCWQTLFIENHDNPRMISKVDSRPEYRLVLGKLLAMIQLTLKGTPFIFQGQELGLINKDFKEIEDFRDIESINLYQELIKEKSKEEAMEIILSGSRDHARTPMPWSSQQHGGFTSGTPWIGMDEDYKSYNAAVEVKDEGSIYTFYKRLIALRKESLTLVYGDFQVVDEKVKDLFTYFRNYNGQCYYVECNLSQHAIKRKRPVTDYQLVMSNYKDAYKMLRPYEANLYEIKCFHSSH